MRRGFLRRLVGAFTGLTALLGVGCGDPGSLSEAARRERIAELYSGYRKSFDDVPALTAAELADHLGGDAPPVMVDVRTPREQAVSMIAGAITRETFESRAEELRGRTVVTYCTIGYRSGLYAAKLRDTGWEAYNLEGSILEWTHEGGDLVADGEPTRRLHVYGRTWDLAADGYETVW